VRGHLQAKKHTITKLFPWHRTGLSSLADQNPENAISCTYESEDTTCRRSANDIL